MAEIQFSKGIKEEVVPSVRLTRSRTGETGAAMFSFESPTIFNSDRNEEITGMYLVDEEGEMVTREVNGKFINGKPQFLEAKLNINSKDEWERFMRFMERYSQENGLEFTKTAE